MVNNKKQEGSYRIIIRGRLKEQWAEWFDGLVVSIEHPDPRSGNTTLIARVPDQAALRGLMNKIWDLNLTLISVTCCENHNFWRKP